MIREVAAIRAIASPRIVIRIASFSRLYFNRLLTTLRLSNPAKRCIANAYAKVGYRISDDKLMVRVACIRVVKIAVNPF